MFIGLVGYENTCCMQRIEGKYNNSLINTERQAALQKRRYTKKKLKINNDELLNISNMFDLGLWKRKRLIHVSICKK